MNGVLSRIVADTEAREVGDGKWMAKCPAHEDKTASLSIAKGDKHPVVLNCMAGCTTNAVLDALGLTMADVLADRSPSTWKQNHVETERSQQATSQQKRIVSCYDYRDSNEKLQFQVVRFEPKDFRQRQPKPDGMEGWQWNLKGIDKPVLYRLSEVLAANDVLLVEGEKDADNALKALGIVATTNAGGAKKFKQHHAEFLRDKRVTIIPDNDPSGRAHVEQVRQMLDGIAENVVVVELPGLPEKGDLSDWIVAGGTREQLDELIKAKDQRLTFAGIDASELHQFESQPVDWLVSHIFSADQPTIFGAASKATKTTQLVDLSVALATKSDWLDTFSIPKQRKVLLITGEANNRAVSRRIGRALGARDIGWDSLKGWLHVEAVEFPILPDATHLAAISRDVERNEFDVVIVDPLYRGLRGLDTNKMVDVGSAIVAFSQACHPASLILSHHVTKSSAREGGAPTLECLSGAGIAESSGNWWLIGRNEPYKFDGQHDLGVVYGGRDEQSGIKRIQFNEEDWTFEITSGVDIKEQREAEREAKRCQAEQQKLNQARAGIKNAMANQKTPVPKSWFEDRSGQSQQITRKAVASLLNDGTLVDATYTDSRNRDQTGWILNSNIAEYETRIGDARHAR